MNLDPPPGSDVGSAADASVGNTSISTKDKASTVLTKSATMGPVTEDSAASEPKEKPKAATIHLPDLTPVKENWYGMVGMGRPKAKNDADSDSSDGGIKLPAAEDKSDTEEPAKEDSAVSTLEELLKPTTSQLSQLAPPLKKTGTGLNAGTETPNPKYTAVKEYSVSDPEEMKSATPQLPDLTTPIKRTSAGLKATTKVETRMKAADCASSNDEANIPAAQGKSGCESPDSGAKLESILSDDEPMAEGTPVETPKRTPEAKPVKNNSITTENPKADDEPAESKPSMEGQTQPAADSSALAPQAITAPVRPPPTTIPLTVNSSTSSAPHPPTTTTWPERDAAPQTTSNTSSSSMVSSRLSLSISPTQNSTDPPTMTSALGAPIDPAIPLSPTHLTSHLAAAASSPLAPPPGPHIQALRIIAGAPAKIVPLTLITSKWGWIVDLTPYIKMSKSLPTPVRFLDWKKDGELRVYQPFFDDELDEASGKVLKQMEEDEDNDVPLMERGPYTVIAKATRKGGCVVVKTRGRDAVDVMEKDVEGIVKMVNRLEGW